MQLFGLETQFWSVYCSNFCHLSFSFSFISEFQVWNVFQLLHVCFLHCNMDVELVPTSQVGELFIHLAPLVNELSRSMDVFSIFFHWFFQINGWFSHIFPCIFQINGWLFRDFLRFSIYFSGINGSDQLLSGSVVSFAGDPWGGSFSAARSRSAPAEGGGRLGAVERLGYPRYP